MEQYSGFRINAITNKTDITSNRMIGIYDVTTSTTVTIKTETGVLVTAIWL